MKADSVEEARKKLKSQIPEGYCILSETISAPGTPKITKGWAQTADLAFNKVLVGLPPGTRVIDKKEAVQPGDETVVIEAYDENDAIAKTKQVMEHPVSVQDCVLKKQGKRGFLGFGRKPNSYELTITHPAVVEVTYVYEATIWASIGPSRPVVCNGLRDSMPKAASAHAKDIPARFLFPPFMKQLKGFNRVHIGNPNDCGLTVGLRAGVRGRDFDVPSIGAAGVNVPVGEYDIYCVYSCKPYELFQGSSFRVEKNDVAIALTKFIGGSYNILDLKGEAIIRARSATFSPISYTVLRSEDAIIFANRPALRGTSDIHERVSQTCAKDMAALNLFPSFQEQLKGRNELRITNSKDFKVWVAIRSGRRGKDFAVPPHGFAWVYLPPGTYDIYFNYSNEPANLLQGERLTLKGSRVEIQIVEVLGGNYRIRRINKY